MSKTYTSGEIHSVSQKGEGQYSFVQQAEPDSLPPDSFLGNPGSKPGINFSFGPLTIKGYIDTETLGVGLDVTLFGILLGSVYGNLNDGIGINIDIIAAKGTIGLYLKNGNEMWAKASLKPLWGSEIKFDEKVFSW